MADKKQIPSTLATMALVLTLIALIAAALLSLVYVATKEPIAQAEKAKQEKALASVLPAFDNDLLESLEKGKTDPELSVYTAEKNGQTIAFAVETYSNSGYGGLVRLMLGYDLEGKIYGMSVLAQSETPGLGVNMTKAKFQQQFIGKSSENFTFKVKKDGGDVDALTAATISSRAVCDAVSRANKEVQVWLSANSLASKGSDE